MYLKKIVLITSLLSLSSLAFGAQEPSKSKLDTRMQHQSYSANDVTVIRAKNGFATAITFASDERIIDIAVGFNGWEVVDNNNVLYIKPVALGDSENAFEPTLKEWDTNLLITTNKRQYAFDLILVSDEASTNAYFVKFAYPNEEARARAEAKAKLAKEQEAQRVNSELDNFTVPKNWDFAMKVGKESRSIAPSFAYDDGVRTYLGFNNSTSIPAVFYYQGGQEMMANTNQKQQGTYSVLVVHKTAERYILRSGEQVVGVINHGFGRNQSSETTTAHSNIDRVLK